MLQSCEAEEMRAGFRFGQRILCRIILKSAGAPLKRFWLTKFQIAVYYDLPRWENI